MNERVKKIVEKHIASDLIIESVAMTADYKTNNREAKKLKRLRKRWSVNQHYLYQSVRNVITNLGLFVKQKNYWKTL